MDKIITEKNYPIQWLWVLKANLFVLPAIIIYIPILILAKLNPYSYSLNENELQNPKGDFNMIMIGVVIILSVIISILRKITFHYSFDDKFLFLKQGIVSKQERHIPYGVIQNLFVKQDLLDRIFGLSSLTIENASQGAGALYDSSERKKVEMIGYSGNKISIPGLTKANAEILKGIILQKMKENPIEDSQSGL
ncbi:MAG: PH domain-containing protein [Candidatus Magasanikbacteria bacterium]